MADRIAAENNGAGRAWTAEEDETWKRQNVELDSIDGRLSVVLDAERRQAGIDATLAPYGAAGHTGTGGRSDSELRSVLTGERRSVDLPMPDLERRDLTKAGTGAYVVPQGFAPTLVEAMLQAAVVADVATRFVTAGTGDLKVPAATAHPTAALIAEAGAITESDPTFAQVVLSSYKYATLTQVSTETLEDSGVNIEAYLATRAGEAVGRALGAALVTGTGSSQPQGIVTGSTLGVTAAAAAAIELDELVDLMHSVAPQYRARPGAAWLMADSTAAKIRKLRDESGGAGTGGYLWEPSAQAGQPDLLLGHPVYLDPTMPASTTANKSVLFGDMGAYGVRFSGQVRFERSDDYAFGNDLATFRCVVRADGRMLDTTGAVKHLVQA
jgi:HK97 family phage major capsid protein